MDKKKLVKMIAPVVVAILAILWMAIWAIATSFIMGTIAVCVVVIITIILCGVMIYVTCQRIQEIRKGEEDDLSKY